LDGKKARPAVNLGTRESLADIGRTIAENYRLNLAAGNSFLSELLIN
jgi:phosphopentomutase